MKNNTSILLIALGVIIGVALSANFPSVPEQFASLQAQATGGGGFDEYGDGW